VVAALTVHAGVVAVCEAGSAALLDLSRPGPAHHAALVAAGAVPLLVAAHARHPSARGAAHAALEELGFSDAGIPRPIGGE